MSLYVISSLAYNFLIFRGKYINKKSFVNYKLAVFVLITPVTAYFPL